MRLLLATIAFGLLGLVSCEEPFELEGAGDTKLLIQSSLAAGDAPSVTISSVDAFGDIVEEPVLGASWVTLTNSSGRSFRLNATEVNPSSVEFRADDEFIISGLTYDLKVSVPGYVDARGRTTVPTPPLEFATLTNSADVISINETGDYVQVPFQFSDLADSDNYYHVIVRAAEGQGFPNPRDVRGLVAVRLDNQTLPIPSNEAEGGGRVFSDVDFAGGRLNVMLKVPARALDNLVEPVLQIEVRSVTEEYFLHPLGSGYNSNNHRGRTSNPITQDNIFGGVGVLSSYSTSREYVRWNR